MPMGVTTASMCDDTSRWRNDRAATLFRRPRGVNVASIAMGGVLRIAPHLLGDAIIRCRCGPAGMTAINETWRWRRRTAGGRTDTVKDRKSTRLNSSHLVISYAVFCLKKK